jgi:RHS repeat-associated protein
MRRRLNAESFREDRKVRPRRLRAPERALIVFLAAFMAALAPPGASATNVSGTISTNTTWTLANSPYVMTGNVTVAAGVTLTIQPGVVVQGNASSRLLTVNGSLSAVGTSSQPITFTSTTDSAAGQWNGITFASGSGTSTLDYTNVRYGGDSGASHLNGMITASGGTITIDHSTVSSSKVSGLAANGGSTGSGLSLTIRHTKFENNGFNGSTKQGDGLYANNASLTIRDSAFWSNAIDGVSYQVSNTYTASRATIAGSSLWSNKRFGVYISDANATTLGLASDVSGQPPNDIYDNGTFGFSINESWSQLSTTNPSSTLDWSNNYWGPMISQPCAFGTQTGHLSYSYPDPDPGALRPVDRGPVSHGLAVSGQDWCGNDDAKSDPPAYDLPDLYFNPPPPTFGGLIPASLWNCKQCMRQFFENAGGLDAEGPNPAHNVGDPVNTATGDLFENATDLRLGGPGIPFVWARSYNSADTGSSGLGVGWTDMFEAKLTLGTPLVYRAGSGQEFQFTKTSGGSTGAATYAAKGFDGVLTRLQGDSFQLVTRDQRTFLFDSTGKLTQIKPRFLPATTLAYTSSKLSSITDSAGRTISVSYSVQNPTLIDKVTLPDGRYVQYGYTNSRLTSVQDARGKTWTLTYDANGRLTSVQDPLGHYELQSVLYDGQGRVTSEQDGIGADDTIGYAYTSSSPYDITTVTIPGRGDWVYKHVNNLLISVTDPLGHTTSYTYDAMGRTASVTDPRGYRRRFEYDHYGNQLKQVAPAAVDGFAITRTYNSTNQLLTEKDGRGNTTSYAYATGSDPAADYQVGQLKTTTDRENGVTTFKYWTTTSSPTPPADNVGLLKSLTNQRSKTSTYDYDSSGNLTKITSPLGLKTTMGYDTSGRLTSRRDPRGNVPNPPSGYLTQWSYDNVDHISSLTDTRGNVSNFDFYDNELPWKITRYENDGTPRVTSFQYDAANRLWKTTSPRSGVETRLYWPDGQLKSVDSPEHRLTSYSYDTAGRLTTMVEPNGNATGATASDWTWTYTYDNSGNRDSLSHPDGGETSIDYDGLNRPFEWTDPLGHTKSVEYDHNDNVLTRTDGLLHQEHFTYDKLDRLKTSENELSKTWTYDYYATGELQDVITPLGNKRSYGIDDDGRTTSMVDPRGNVTGANPADYTWSYGYDEADNRKSVRDPLGNESDYVYDGLNDLTQVTDQRGNVTTFTYDSMNRLSAVTPPAAGASGNLNTAYGYDADGNLASRTDPNGHTTGWQYDLDGLQTQRTIPVVGSWNSTYDANGNLKTLETPAGSSTQTVGDGTITSGYNRMSRLTSTDYSDSTPDVTRTWDDAGRPATMSDGSGTVTYTFDNADRLTDIVRSGGGSGLNGTFHYDYNDGGQITGRTYPDSSSMTATFDDDGRLHTVTSSSATTTFDHDAAGNLTTTTLPSGNGYVETRTFDQAGRLTGVDNAKSGTSLSKFVWTLDAVGNPTKAQTTRGGSDTYEAYGYDARNRLTAWCFGIAASATDCSGAANLNSYSYDKVSNRAEMGVKRNSGPTFLTDYTYNDADQLTSATDHNGTTNYTYDANGDLASRGSDSFTSNLAGELVSATVGGTSSTYSYDGDGRRLSSTVSGGADLRFTWDPLAESGIPEIALERDSSGNLVRRYLGGPLGTVSFANGSGNFYYQHDPLGNVSDVTDASGAAQWQYAYEAYGAERSATNVSGSAPVNPLRFEGQYLDASTGLYQLRARPYDPATGRFASLDPIDGSAFDPAAGAYVYADAQPTTLTDPLGLSPQGGSPGNDPHFGRYTIDCSRNATLCKLIKGSGYGDRTCTGSCVMRTLKTLGGRGITPEDLIAVATGKGKIVSVTDGPNGDGLYFVGGGHTRLISAPQDDSCGLVCAWGQAATALLGCDSELGCAVQAGTLFIGGGECRAAEGEESLLSRIGQALASERGSIGRPTPLTNSQATDLARWNGFEPTGESRRGQIIFRRRNRYIIQDIDSHMGGTWKMADSPAGLRSKRTRMGTYDERLNRIGP